MKSLLPRIILLFLLIAAVTIINFSAEKQTASPKIYSDNIGASTENELTPQKLPQTKNEVQIPADNKNNISMSSILDIVRPIIASFDFRNLIGEEPLTTPKKNNNSSSDTIAENNPLLQNIFLDKTDTKLTSFGDGSSFGGSVLSEQCGGGPAPIEGVGKTFENVVWAYDVCSTHPPEIEPSHPQPPCISANYVCPPPCACLPKTFTVSERDIMYPIIQEGEGIEYQMTKIKCTCFPVACNVICSPNAWTWDSATNTCVCAK